MIIEGLGQQLALILFYFGKEPDTIEDFARYWGMLEFALSFEDKFKKQVVNFG